MALLGPHLIVGLGNPGPEYADTRHNAGFKVIDAFAAELGVSYWKIASNALVGETSYQGEKIVLAKPQSFMNVSGGPVRGVAARYDFAVENILIIHDELDLPAGTIRLKLGGGHAGHNGLRSLHQAIGAEYARLRVGIGRPPGRMPPHAYVLKRMGGQELEEFEVSCARAALVVRTTLEEGLVRAMNTCNRDEDGRTRADDRPTDGGEGDARAGEEHAGTDSRGGEGDHRAGSAQDGNSHN
jgi:PTH1 family peptidyl-tRNA hydrolase